MASSIDTLGKAVRHGIVVRVECRGCGNVREFASHELMMKVGGGRDPLTLRFRCRKCAPAAKVTLREPYRPSMTGRTLGDVLDAGESLYVNCHDPRCQNRMKLDVEALVQRLGRDHGAMHDDLVRLFRCSKCRAAGREGRKIGFTCIPDYKRADRERMQR